jgi:indolepyruvate ferredoxin oxidoreductase
MLHPLDGGVLREFADGLEEVFVIEEKRSLLESALRDAMYALPDRPRIVGKRDEHDKPLVKAYGELDSDDIALLIHQRLVRRIPREALHDRAAEMAAQPLPLTLPMVSSTARTPYYCSGCPHNTSTLSVPQGALVGAGIGCHTMTLLIDKTKDAISGLTQMGGEGVQWVGASPFTDTDHLYQNIGDGTLFHSGTLAIRQAIAAKAHITYKILWNSAVAMTGGQDPEVNMSVWQLTHLLRAEGVDKIIVTTPEPTAYPANAHWAEGVEVWHRDRIEEAQLALREHRAVTVLIHDQECAAELRRKRRRGLAEEPSTRVFINEAVCEGCGDCGEKSNCLSVFPVETEFGRKTQIHQSSCNKDYSCLKGDCPAFITVEPDTTPRQAHRPSFEMSAADLPAPVYRTHGESNLYMLGIGGTGVVTVNQILGTAAVIDGKSVVALDQTGLSQKGGPVVSHIKIKDGIDDGANKVSRGRADGYLVFDELTGAQTVHLMHATPGRTVAITSTSVVPTGQMVANGAVRYPGLNHLHKSIDAMTTPEANVYFNAIEVSEALFGSHMQANLMMVGAAFQRGLIPVSAEAIEQAITLNGVAVKANVQAFRVGRRIVVEPAWVDTLKTRRQGELDYTPETLNGDARALVESVAPEGELRRLLELRVPELIAYQNIGYARQYVEFIGRVRRAEQQAAPNQTRLSEAVAKYLFKLMAYKDEYEVARLHLKANVRAEIADQFGSQAKAAVMLHPPLLRSLGLKRKLKLGAWFTPFLKLLRGMKGLRGTPFDIFGLDGIRKTERALIGEYRAAVESLLPTLASDYDRAVKLAELPDLVRGYDHVKLRNVAAYRAQMAALLKR